ncbi:Uncharacterised protein [Chlamydia trachomatis]|nr:Uncharacterised protein [Chlamydia trachomatis]
MLAQQGMRTFSQPLRQTAKIIKIQESRTVVSGSFYYTIHMNKEELMEDIGRFCDQKSSDTTRICGNGASGKSTLSADLAQYLGK